MSTVTTRHSESWFVFVRRFIDTVMPWMRSARDTMPTNRSVLESSVGRPGHHDAPRHDSQVVQPFPAGPASTATTAEPARTAPATTRSDGVTKIATGAR